ncbi:MAG: hypothetical protein ACTSRS_01630 [Candidatus Helarchaeota archaeon]
MTLVQKIKRNIKINPNNCAQCLSCMLICSFVHCKAFNPSQAYIQIIPGYFEGSQWIPTKIVFREECKPNCHLCSQYCAYDALSVMETE